MVQSASPINLRASRRTDSSRASGRSGSGGGTATVGPADRDAVSAVGAGSDAHVLQGVGTGALRLRRFDGPEEFLLALRTAEVLRRPKSLAYLQSLKWVAQARDKFTPAT